MNENAPKSDTTVAIQTPSKPAEPAGNALGDRHLLERGVAIALLVLMSISWRLWWGSSTYPAIPLTSWLGEPSWLSHPWLSRALLLAIGAALLLLILNSRCPSRIWWLISVCLAVLFMFDQHRLQPWAYQACLYGFIFAAFDKCDSLRWMRWITASIYIYSACGKFDFQFLHTVGQQFVSLILGSGGPEPTLLRLCLAAALPLFELSVGVGLLFGNTRRCAGAGAMLMHTGLIIALGPWLLGHSWGVLTWNVALLLQAWFLFVRRTDKSNSKCSLLSNVEPPRHTLAKQLATPLLLLALLLPLTERWGLWDHWLSWSLYSPHTSRVTVEIHNWAVPQLPAYLQPYLSAEAGEDGWRRLSLERWSLQELGVPVYPQARYQLKLAITVANRLNDPQAIRCEVKSMSDRWTGQRTTTQCLGKDELQQALQKNSWLE